MDKREQKLIKQIRKMQIFLSKVINRVTEGVEDDISRKSQNEHYRRYFKEEDFIEKILISGFKILYSKSSKSFSKYKQIYQVKDLRHDPLLLRIILSR